MIAQNRQTAHGNRAKAADPEGGVLQLNMLIRTDPEQCVQTKPRPLIALLDITEE